jgi:hypothetical protein
MARAIAEQHYGLENAKVGEHWISRFLDSHSDIYRQFTRRIKQEGEDATKLAAIKTFFDRLAEV